MSVADEDTELRDLVTQTLESNGMLSKLRAQLRANVFLALEDQEKLERIRPYDNHELQRFTETEDGKISIGIIREFLKFYKLDCTLSVFEPEINYSNGDSDGICNQMLNHLNMDESKVAPNFPLLPQLFHSESKTCADKGDTVINNMELTELKIHNLKKKFTLYDKDSNNHIDKGELQDLLVDVCPQFPRRLLESLINNELSQITRNPTNEVSIEEFLDLYKRFYSMCKAVLFDDNNSLPNEASYADDKSVDDRSINHSLANSDQEILPQGSPTKENAPVTNDLLSERSSNNLNKAMVDLGFEYEDEFTTSKEENKTANDDSVSEDIEEEISVQSNNITEDQTIADNSASKADYIEDVMKI